MIEFVGLDHGQELDQFVQAHPRGHFMQTSRWGRFKAEWDWRGILCRDGGGRILGSMAVLLRRVRGTGYRLLYAPRGPIYTPGDGRILAELVAAAVQLGRRAGGYLLRMDPELLAGDDTARRQVERLGFKIHSISDFSSFQPRLIYQIDLRDQTPGSLFSAFHSGTRYNIRLAQRRGVTVELAGPEQADCFASLMEHTARRDGFQPRRQDYFRDLLEAFPDQARMYLALYQGQVIAGAICLHMGRRTWDLYSCSGGMEQHKPNELLKWTAIQWAMENGSDCFDLRGVEGYPTEYNPKIGLHRFKQGFHSEFVEYIGQLDLTLKPVVARCIGQLQHLALSWGQKGERT